MIIKRRTTALISMNLYENHILPRIIDFICGHRAFAEQRARMIPMAEGRVLEVGYGTGTSLPWYNASKVSSLIALDPAPGAMAMAAKREAAAAFPVEHLSLRGEEIPLEDASVDTIVVAYTLCTIPDVARAIAGMRRVIKPGGQLLFMEHGVSPNPRVERWQHRMNTAWGFAFGGCNLVRKPTELLEQGGFKIVQGESLDIPRPLPIPGITLVKHNYIGVAQAV